MTTTIFFATNQLGEVTDEQLQRMLARFDLGQLTAVTKTAKGVGNQTLFVRSSAGEFVLKGHPLFPGQFTEEQFYVESLLKRTDLPVPSPYLVDQSTDIFGWPYAVMPRLPGRHLSEPAFWASLSQEDKGSIAALLAATLGQLHSWQVEQSGEWDPESRSIRPFAGSYRAWLDHRIRYWLDDARKYSVITPSDLEWVGELLAAGEEALDRLHAPTYVMGDFKADNLLLQGETDHWRLSGLFDFTNGYFGDGLADLPKMILTFLRAGEQGMARRLVTDYYDHVPAKQGFRERLHIHLLHQLVLDWCCAKATRTVTWDDHLSLADWSRPYLEAVDEGLR